VSDSIRAGIQQVLDEDGGGWRTAHYVVAVGLERIVDGEIETAAWLYAEPNQPNYITDGLLLKAEELHHCVVSDEDD
jgi:hypothetical protein